ncbi:MAG: hypothetical protein K2N16_01485 [Muribaculaceae bacterium]|nr:hypothetical protein [Muribaculaceae bacterium]
MDQKYIIALEFSGSQVKGALVKAPSMPSSPMAIPSVEVVAHEDKASCVQYGRVHNLIDAAKDATIVIQKLENSPKIRLGKIKSAYVGLAGRSLGSMHASAELVLATEQEITADIVKRLIGEATKMVPGDKMALAVLPTRFIVNNQATKSPVGALGSKIKGEFTVVTCSPVNRRNLERVLDDRLHLAVKDFVVTPLALADMVLGEEEKQLGCVLVDLGAQTTTVSIYKDRALQHLATLPMGSNNITIDIATGLSEVKERAELVKIRQANALPEPVSSTDVDANRLNCYVQARLGEIIANVAAQIEFAGFKPSDLSAGYVLTGRGAKLKNMAKAFEAQTKMKARYASIPATVSVADSSVEPADYASLIAIALAGAKAADTEGCVEMPQAAPRQPEHDDTFDPYADDGDDSDVLLDSDDEERSKLQKADRQRVLEQQAAKRELELKRKEQQRKQAQNKPPKPSLGDILRRKITNFFTDNGEGDGEVDLDDNV